MNNNRILKLGVVIWLGLSLVIFGVSFESVGEQVIGFVTMTTSLFSLLGIYYAYVQIVTMQKQDLVSQEVREKELVLLKAQKSVQLADEFREILGDCSLLGSVYQKNVEYVKLFEAIDYNKISTFRYSELQRLFNGDCINIINNRYQYMYDNFKDTYESFELYEKLHGKYENVQKVMQTHDYSESEFFLALFELEYNQENVDHVKSMATGELIDDKTSQKYFFFVQNILEFKDFKFYMINLIEGKSNDVLNHLEVFSMAINLGLADDGPLYPSLHQAFLDTVRILYPTIAAQNDGEHTDHFYIHIRKLYKKWAKRYMTEVLQYEEKILKIETSDPDYDKVS